MKPFIDLYVKESPDKIASLYSQALSDKLRENKNVFTILHYGSQKSLIETVPSPVLRFNYDDFSFDRAATTTVKNAIAEYLRDNQIKEALLVDLSGGERNAMQRTSGFFGAVEGARVNIGPITRPAVSREELLAAANAFNAKFPGLKFQEIFNEHEAMNLVAAFKGMSAKAELFASRVTPQKILATPNVVAESTKKYGSNQ